jgi:hypothetical protein
MSPIGNFIYCTINIKNMSQIYILFYHFIIILHFLFPDMVCLARCCVQPNASDWHPRKNMDGVGNRTCPPLLSRLGVNPPTTATLISQYNLLHLYYTHASSSCCLIAFLSEETSNIRN